MNRARIFNPLFNDNGSAVLLSILISAIIITVAVGFNWLVKEHVKGAIALKSKTRAMVKVYSAFDTLTYGLLMGTKTDEGVTLPDRQLFDIYEVAANNSPVVVWDDVEIRVQDANGLLSLYEMDYTSLSKLLKILEIKNSAVIIDSLQDWIDGDHMQKANGAEKDYYASKGYKPRNSKVDYLEELLLVRGMTREALKKLKPHITLMYNSGFNPQTATDEVFMAVLGIGDDKLAKYQDHSCAVLNSVFTLDRGLGEYCIISENLLITVSHEGGDGYYKIRSGIGFFEDWLYPYKVYSWSEG